MPSSDLTLSLLRLPRSDARWRSLSAYGAHQLVWNAFADLPGDADRPFLFTHDVRSGPSGGFQSLLVQSTRPPDWEHVGPEADVRTKTVPAQVPEGTRLGFTLRANPTVSREGFADGKRRRIGVGTNAALAFERMGRAWPAPAAEVEAWRQQSLRAWMERQGERGGFAVEDVQAGPVEARRIVRSARDGERAMTLHEVGFSGQVRVTDEAAFCDGARVGDRPWTVVRVRPPPAAARLTRSVLRFWRSLVPAGAGRTPSRSRGFRPPIRPPCKRGACRGRSVTTNRRGLGAMPRPRRPLSPPPGTRCAPRGADVVTRRPCGAPASGGRARGAPASVGRPPGRRRARRRTARGACGGSWRGSARCAPR